VPVRFTGISRGNRSPGFQEIDMKTVWYVQEMDNNAVPVLFSTKMAAEIYARQLFPHASPDVRYSRIYYRSVWEESDMKETS